MLSESVDSTEIEPDDRSQPQISAIFPYLGTRFPQVEWAFHKKWTPACASAQNQTSLPTGHSMAAPQMGPEPDKEDPATAPRKKFRVRWQATRVSAALQQAAPAQATIVESCSGALTSCPRPLSTGKPRQAFRQKPAPFPSRPTSLISPSRQAMPRKLHAPKRRCRRAGRDFRPSAGRRPAPPRAPDKTRRP